MGTLIKRKGLFPSRENKSANQFFNDFITTDFSDWADKNFTALDNKPPSAAIKETGTSREMESTAPEIKREDFRVKIDNILLMNSSEEEEEEVMKKSNFNRKKFNYRTFCRLPNH